MEANQSEPLTERALSMTALQLIFSVRPCT